MSRARTPTHPPGRPGAGPGAPTPGAAGAPAGGRLRHRVLGIDPGSRNTGFGVIDTDGQRSVCVASGCIRVGQHPWPDRLGMINHTLLTVEHLRGRGIEIFGVVLNGGANDENKRAVETYGRVPVLARIDTLAEVTPAALAAQFAHFVFPPETARKGTP